MKNVLKRTGRSALSAALVLAALLGPGATLAYMTDSENTVNTVDPAKLSLRLDEPAFIDGQKMRPGDSIAKDPEVTNTDSVPMLVFLTVEVPEADVRTVDPETKKIIESREHELFSYDVSDSWRLLDSYFVEERCAVAYVYGYLEVLPRGETTAPLFNSVTFLNILEGEIAKGTVLTVDLNAFGIQSDNVFEGFPVSERLVYGYETFLKGA